MSTRATFNLGGERRGVSFLPHEYPIYDDTEEAALGVYADKFNDSEEGWNAWRAVFSGGGDASMEEDEEDEDKDETGGDAAGDTTGDDGAGSEGEVEGAQHADHESLSPGKRSDANTSTNVSVSEDTPPANPEKLLLEAIESVASQRLARTLPDVATRVVEALAQVVPRSMHINMHAWLPMLRSWLFVLQTRLAVCSSNALGCLFFKRAWLFVLQTRLAVCASNALGCLCFKRAWLLNMCGTCPVVRGLNGASLCVLMRRCAPLSFLPDVLTSAPLSFLPDVLTSAPLSWRFFLWHDSCSLTSSRFSGPSSKFCIYFCFLVLSARRVAAMSPLFPHGVSAFFAGTRAAAHSKIEWVRLVFVPVSLMHSRVSSLVILTRVSVPHPFYTGIPASSTSASRADRRI